MTALPVTSLRRHSAQPGPLLIACPSLPPPTPQVTERVSPDTVRCQITIGGPLKSRKGINVPDLQIDCTLPLTAEGLHTSNTRP